MLGEEYMQMLYVFNYAFDGQKALIIHWPNALKIKCESFTGVYETDTEPGEEDYIGEYAAAVNEIEILEKGSDDSVGIYDNSIEISLVSIPEKIMLEDGTVLWQKA